MNHMKYVCKRSWWLVDDYTITFTDTKATILWHRKAGELSRTRYIYHISPQHLRGCASDCGNPLKGRRSCNLWTIPELQKYRQFSPVYEVFDKIQEAGSSATRKYTKVIIRDTACFFPANAPKKPQEETVPNRTRMATVVSTFGRCGASCSPRWEAGIANLLQTSMQTFIAHAMWFNTLSDMDSELIQSTNRHGRLSLRRLCLSLCICICDLMN